MMTKDYEIDMNNNISNGNSSCISNKNSSSNNKNMVTPSYSNDCHVTIDKRSAAKCNSSDVDNGDNPTSINNKNNNNAVNSRENSSTTEMQIFTLRPSLNTIMKYIILFLLLLIHSDFAYSSKAVGNQTRHHHHHHHHHNHHHNRLNVSKQCNDLQCEELAQLEAHRSAGLVSSYQSDTVNYDRQQSDNRSKHNNENNNNSKTTAKRRLRRETVPTIYGNIDCSLNFLPMLQLSVASCRGIPYAKPPVGKLRFQKPVKPDHWNGTLNATSWPNSCWQPNDFNFGTEFYGSNMWNPNTKLSEDCLYLNVFATNHALNDKRRKRPVMVWIYGGGFYSGTSSLPLYDGSHLAGRYDVVVVSMNYRLGFWGFFSLGRPETPTNLGLWDQLMALSWVKENIAFFGGDPDSVTLFGESAGAVSVSLHLLSQKSWTFFHRAILQSGTANMPWAVVPLNETIRRSEILVAELNCNYSPDIDEILRCLNKKNNSDIIENQWVSRGFLQFPWVPTIDGDFIRKNPEALLADGMFKQCPILLGSNLNEASFFLIYEFGNLMDLNSVNMTYKNTTNCINTVFNYFPQFPKVTPNSVLKAINFYYTYESSKEASSLENFQNLDRAASDGQFICPLNVFAKAYVRRENPVYMYYFTERVDNHVWPGYMGVLHADEIFFTMNDGIMGNMSFTTEERALFRKMTEYWTTFAATGNPEKHNAIGETWEVSYKKSLNYMELNSYFIRLAKGEPYFEEGGPNKNFPREKHCRFWYEYVSSMLAEHKNNCLGEGLSFIDFDEISLNEVQISTENFGGFQGYDGLLFLFHFKPE